jgi:hypothetical protein
MAQKLKLVSHAIAALSCALCLSNAAFGQALPDGKGKKEFIDNCTDCHRSEMVTRVKKTPDEWRKSVDEMASRGSQGTKEDLDNVVIYLDTYFSTETPSSTSATRPTTPPSISSTSATYRRYLALLP